MVISQLLVDSALNKEIPLHSLYMIVNKTVHKFINFVSHSESKDTKMCLTTVDKIYFFEMSVTTTRVICPTTSILSVLK